MRNEIERESEREREKEKKRLKESEMFSAPAHGTLGGFGGFGCWVLGFWGLGFGFWSLGFMFRVRVAFAVGSTSKNISARLSLGLMSIL